MLKTSLSALSLSLLGIITGFSQPTKIDIQKGQKYQVETTNKTTSSAEVMGQTMETLIDSKSITLVEVMNNNPDGTDLQATATKVLLTSSMMGQDMSFDSDKQDNEGPMAEGLSKLLNKPRAISIDSKGTITKQEIIESDMQGMLTGNNAELSKTTELFIPSIIGKELKAGDSINDIASQTKEKYSSRDSGTYRITKIENGVASITYTGTQYITTVMEQMGMEMNMIINSTVKTELQVDMKTGIVLLKSSELDTNTTVDAGGMTIPATGKTITKIKITPAS
ncbi:MAG: hypothetical protein IPN39_00815 [Chitinophagaceae bacterium]|nr:hypothetical protein [Chitinophagaceae bacterium]